MKAPKDVSPDAELLKRGRRYQLACVELRQANLTEDGEIIDNPDRAAHERAIFTLRGLETVIAGTRAKTPAGLLMKAQILWAYVNVSADNLPREDWSPEEILVDGLMRDLEALAAEAAPVWPSS